MNEIWIHPGNSDQYQTSPQGHAKGLIPRDLSVQPHGCYAEAPPAEVTLIPETEWSKLVAERTKAQARFGDVRDRGMNGQPIPSRDQNGKGYCWAHSGVSCHLIARAAMNEPYADLSAYGVACPVKRFRDEGGNGIDGVQYQAKVGVPTSATWPQQSMDHSLGNSDAVKQDAAKHKCLTFKDIDPSNIWDTVVSAILGNVGPCVGDFNWWSHSVAIIDIVDGKSQFGVFRSDSGKLATMKEHETVWGFDGPSKGYGSDIWNSWGDGWGKNGTGVLLGSHAVPDNAVLCELVSVSSS